MAVARTPFFLLSSLALDLVAVVTASKPVGDISSVVTANGDTFEWPERFAELKKQLRPDAEVLRQAWDRLDKSLTTELLEIERKQQDVVPVVNFTDIQARNGRLPESMRAEIKKRGVVIVRGVVESDVARAWKSDVQQYARDNPSHIGFPSDDPQILELYWSKAQLQARQHPNLHMTMLALNRLWSGGENHVSFEHVHTYGERLRIRKPGNGFSLHPHTDGGSIERFEDPHYQNVYRKILEGQWEEYDPWVNGGERALANTSMYASEVANGYCTIFRAFQGWMAISGIGAGPGAGTLRVLPLLKESMAHLILRPFLDDVPAADFCGAMPGMAHDVTAKWHARLHNSLVAIPKMEPGDTVWWHHDLVHAVEAEHLGKEDSAVFYVPSMPATERNAAYIRKQRERFLEGRTPPDFPPNDSEIHFVGRGTESDLTALGRQMLGFEALAGNAAEATCGASCASDGADGAGELLKKCASILGFQG